MEGLKSPTKVVEVSIASAQTEPDGEHARIVLPIAAPVYDLTFDCLELPSGEADVAQMFWTWPADWLRFDFRNLPLKEITKKAMNKLVHWSQLLAAMPGTAQPEVHLYTDGSYQPKTGRSGYGIAVLLKYANLLAIFGVVGGQILGAESGHWTFDAAPPLQAELVALTGALLWLGQSMTFFRAASATVHFDCQAAGYAADGSWNPCNAYSSKLHGLELLVRGRAQNKLRLKYVRAHHSNEWNEMADVIAKCGANGCWNLPAIPDANCLAFLTHDYSWAAAAEYGQRHKAWPDGPPGSLAISETKDSRPSPLSPTDLVPLSCTEKAYDEVFYEAKALSVNLQGLGGKSKYIEEQLDWRSCQLGFLQETKELGGTCHSSCYLRLGTNADRHWGVAIWIHRRLGALTISGRPFLVEEPDVEIIVKHKRLLIVRIQRAGVTLLLLSGHCPHAGRQQERLEFLQLLEQGLVQHANATIVVGGIDANARLPCDVAGTTGGLEFDDPDESGRMLVAILARCKLWVPSTFVELHNGPDATYRHPSGSLHRIDYLLLGGRAVAQQLWSRVADDFDTANHNDDHWAVELHVGGTVNATTRVERFSDPGSTVKKCWHLKGERLYDEPWNAMCRRNGMFPVDEHCKQFQNYLVAVLNEHFQPESRGPRASYIPAEVWEWRTRKLALKKTVGYRRPFWKEQLRAALQRWMGQEDVGYQQWVRKQGILYQLSATAIVCVTRAIKSAIAEAKSKFFNTIVGQGPTSTCQLLRTAKRYGVGGKQGVKAKPRVTSVVGPRWAPSF